MERDCDLDDKDIVNAVSYHTTGRAGMSTLEKIIYIADAVEPGRFYPGVEEIRAMAFKDLDMACYMSMKSTENFVKSAGKYLDPDTVLAREYLENIINK